MMNNMEYANRILNEFENFFKLALIDCEQGLNNPKLNKMIKASISDDFLSKISYVFSNVGKFFLITCLKVDSAMVSFDTYKHYKERHQIETFGDKRSALIDEFFSVIKERIDIYKNLCLLISDVRKYVQMNGADNFIKIFFSYKNENNKIWSLIKTCQELGINVGSYKSKISNNEADRTSELSLKISNIMNEYLNKNIKINR